MESEPAPDILTDPDSLRELVHEIKTPLNAIIGFAEIIEGQYLGPADHRYRARASEIVRQARLLLGAIDDLDFAAKIHSSATDADRRTDVKRLLDQVESSLNEVVAAKGVEVEVIKPAATLIAAVESEVAERLVSRLAGAAIQHAEPRERLRIAADISEGQARIIVGKPASLRNLSDIQLFEATVTASSTGEDAVLPAGFSLRLVRGLARIAGGDLSTTPTEFVLAFPRA